MVLALLAAVLPLADDPAFPSMDSCFVIETGDSVGAGFMTDGNLIVTAAHVVGDATAVALTTGEVAPRRFSGRVVLADRATDIAVIVPSRETGVVPLELTSDPPAVGDVVYTVGSPIRQLVASRGIVTDTRSDRIESTTPVDHGNSGGPLIDEEGRVAGVVVELSRLTDHALSVPATTVERVILRAQDVPMTTVPEAGQSDDNSRTAIVAGVVLALLVVLVTATVMVSSWARHRRRERNRIIITFEGN